MLISIAVIPTFLPSSRLKIKVLPKDWLGTQEDGDRTSLIPTVALPTQDEVVLLEHKASIVSIHVHVTEKPVPIHSVGLTVYFEVSAGASATKEEVLISPQVSLRDLWVIIEPRSDSLVRLPISVSLGPPTGVTGEGITLAHNLSDQGAITPPNSEAKTTKLATLMPIPSRITARPEPTEHRNCRLLVKGKKELKIDNQIVCIWLY